MQAQLKKYTTCHKDRTPEETIKIIKKILDSHGIAVQEIKSISSGDKIFSFILYVASLNGGSPLEGGFGKGASEALARASAYGELMERLQNINGLVSCGIIPNEYGLMPHQIELPHDAEKETWKDFQKRHPYIASTLYPNQKNLPKPELEIFSVPFFHINKRKLISLPISHLLSVTGSNGMCAGNTPEEALLQGLCEVCERYAEREAFLARRPLPSIPRDVIKDTASFETIRYLEENGLRIVIKDATIGGKYPVVAALIVHPQMNRYSIRFGSDPILDVAIQRCLTEALQNYTFKEYLTNKMLPILWTASERKRNSFFRNQDIGMTAVERLIHSADAHFDDCIFYTDVDASSALDCFQSLESNSDMLGKLIAKLQTFGHEIFIRDSSIMGFPTYFAYIPGMSEIFQQSRFDTESFEFLLTLPTQNDHQIGTFCSRVERENWQPAGAGMKIGTWFGRMIFKEDSDLQSFLMRDMLLAHLYLSIRDYRGAYLALQRHLEEIENQNYAEIDNPDYTYAVLSCLKLKAEDKSDLAIQAMLDELYGEQIRKEVFDDILFSKNRFGDFKLPICGDCDPCPVKSDCYFPQWNELRENLNRIIQENPIDQNKLSEVFA